MVFLGTLAKAAACSTLRMGGYFSSQHEPSKESRISVREISAGLFLWVFTRNTYSRNGLQISRDMTVDPGSGKSGNSARNNLEILRKNGGGMDHSDIEWGQFGSVEELIAPHPVKKASPLLQSQLAWRPSEEIQQRTLQTSTEAKPLEMLQINALQFAGGRGLRLAPPDVGYLIACAKLWGRAILEQAGVWSSGHGYDLDLNWFLYQKSRRTQAFLKRAFRGVKDLRVSRKAQLAVGSQHILSVVYRGKPLDEMSLLELGAQTAEVLGMRPTVATKIRLGLYACAKDNPLDLEREHAGALIRRALFDEDKAPVRVNPKILAHMKLRAGSAIRDHTFESLTMFHEWIWGPGNTFLSQLAKQTKQPGGRLDREDALAAMVQLGWEGVLQLAECVEALMCSVTKNLPEGYQLVGDDRKLFELLYYRQERLGGLPLIMIKDRFSFAKEAIRDLMESPDDERCFQVLYRQLSDYVALANQRRLADRLTKKKRTVEYQDSDQPDELDEDEDG